MFSTQNRTALRSGGLKRRLKLMWNLFFNFLLYNKKILFCYIIYPSLINLVRSWWLEFNLFLFDVFMNHDFVSVHKNIRIQPTFSPLSLTLGQWHTYIYIYIYIYLTKFPFEFWGRYCKWKIECEQKRCGNYRTRLG